MALPVISFNGTPPMSVDREEFAKWNNSRSASGVPLNQGRGGRNGVEAVLSVFVHSHRLDHGWGALKNPRGAPQIARCTMRVGVNKGFPFTLK